MAATLPTLTPAQAKQEFVEEQTALQQAAARGLPIVSAMAHDNRRMIALQPALECPGGGELELTSASPRGHCADEVLALYLELLGSPKASPHAHAR